MAVTLLRTVLLYILLCLFVRVMGKRQIGQLQPAEFVVTMLLSEIIAMPIENPNLPFWNAVAAASVLAALEILLSVLCLKSERIRRSVQGSAILIIKKGKIDEKALRDLRFTVDDVLEALRKKDIFDPAEVQYAIAETDGSLSVLLKSENQPPTLSDMSITKPPTELPVAVVCDGKKINRPLGGVKIDDNHIQKLLKKQKLRVEDILLMCASSDGSVTVFPKEKKE